VATQETHLKIILYYAYVAR